jgi:hypothetical protein
MLSAYHVHPEFGYFCSTPYRRRELLVAVVSILFGAMIGGSIATLRAAHDPNPDGASTASRVDLSNSERVPVAAAEATPVAPTDADTKVEAKESIKPFPIRRVRVRPAVPNPLSPAVDPTAAKQAGVVTSASPPVVERSESAQGSEPPAASSHATKSAAAQRPSTAVKKQQRIAHAQSGRRNDERDDYSWYDNRGNYWSGRTYVDAYYLRAR